MVLHTFYLLIVLVTLTGNEHDVTFLCHHASRLDGFLTVNNRQHFLHLLLVQTGYHIIDDGLRILEAGVVTRDDDLVALFHGFLGHEWALAVVTVAAGPTHGDDMSLAIEHFMDGVEHVLQSIRRMGIVHDGREAGRRMDRLQTTADTVERAEHNEDLFRILA